MNKAVRSTREDDSAYLKDKIGHYVSLNPAAAALSYPIHTEGGSTSHMGLNHPVLARLLCPITVLADFQTDPEETRQQLISGKIKMFHTEYPTFLWEGDPPANDFKEDNIHQGLFKGYLLERVST
ncbi:hypothetical protein BS17DRAFT_690623 [Gyrodon lividus]|nr:hypothetical protein BS17DRAFT_690623 [Gyrodon lividus]